MPPGTLLFFYTDGLVERRDVSVDVGLKHLCAAVTSDQPCAVCQTVMGLLVGTDEPEDDIALLAVRRSTEEQKDRSSSGGLGRVTFDRNAVRRRKLS